MYWGGLWFWRGGFESVCWQAGGGGVNESTAAHATLPFFGELGGYPIVRGTRARKFVFKDCGTWQRLCTGAGGEGYVVTTVQLHLKSWPRGLLHVDYKFIASSLQAHCMSSRLH